MLILRTQPPARISAGIWARRNCVGFSAMICLTSATPGKRLSALHSTIPSLVALIGRLSLTNGFRVEGHSTFGRTVTPRSSAAYLLRQGGGNFGATKLKFNFGLGFKEPSLVQLFSPDPTFMGNKSLRPERNRSFDFGIEQRLWNDRAKLEVHWFDNRFRDLVEFNILTFPPQFTASFINVAAAKANGAEVILETAPRAGLKFTAGYTYLETRVTHSSSPPGSVFATGNTLFRRPRNSGSLGA